MKNVIYFNFIKFYFWQIKMIRDETERKKIHKKHFHQKQKINLINLLNVTAPVSILRSLTFTNSTELRHFLV